MKIAKKALEAVRSIANELGEGESLVHMNARERLVSDVLSELVSFTRATNERDAELCLASAAAFLLEELGK